MRVHSLFGHTHWMRHKLIEYKFAHAQACWYLCILLKMCHVKRKCFHKEKGNGEQLRLYRALHHTHTHTERERKRERVWLCVCIVYYIFIYLSVYLCLFFFCCSLWQPLCTRALANYAHIQAQAQAHAHAHVYRTDTLYALVWKACASQMTLIRQ